MLRILVGLMQDHGKTLQDPVRSCIKLQCTLPAKICHDLWSNSITLWIIYNTYNLQISLNVLFVVCNRSCLGLLRWCSRSGTTIMYIEHCIYRALFQKTLSRALCALRIAFCIWLYWESFFYWCQHFVDKPKNFRSKPITICGSGMTFYTRKA